MTDAERAVAEAWALARDGRTEEALARLRQLTTDQPDATVAWFELGGMLDWLGREAEALAPYERARALGLSAELQPQWALQYGSTLRNVGRLDDAIRVLREAIGRHPDYPALDLMLALSLLDAGDPVAAAIEALGAGLKPDADGSIERYRRALAAYVEEAALHISRGR
jgi:tetratricopeptide (TPR) repeat protein